MEKHTSAPWGTQGWVPTWAYIPVHDAKHNLVCSIYPPKYGTREEALANARLIAAAPDLLATTKAAEGYLLNAKIDLETGATKATAIKTIEGGLRVLRAAIAKAEGSA
jgi:hypothetical protein